jgi:hypothetical protein
MGSPGWMNPTNPVTCPHVQTEAPCGTLFIYIQVGDRRIESVSLPDGDLPNAGSMNRSDYFYCFLLINHNTS